MAKNLTAEENKAIYDKAMELVLEGYDRQQATAIAFDMFRRGKLIIPRTVNRNLRSSLFRTTFKTAFSALLAAGIIKKKPAK